MSDDLVECRLCERRFRSLGHHLIRAHDMTANAYRDRFGLRRGLPLTGAATRAKLSAAIGRTIQSGRLAAHHASNAERAGKAASRAAVEKRAMGAAGNDLPHGTPATPNEKVEAVVRAIEAGAGVATAVKLSAVSYSTYHAALGRHADLKV